VLVLTVRLRVFLCSFSACPVLLEVSRFHVGLTFKPHPMRFFDSGGNFRLRKMAADFDEVGSHFSKAEIAAAVEEAHALGLKVTADAETFYIEWAVEAGADTIEHPLPRSEETIQLMARKGTAADPTLIPYHIIFDEFSGYFGSTYHPFTLSKVANLDMLRHLIKP